MDAHHRKIDLQSPADLDFLATNIKEVAQRKIDLHIPPTGSDNANDKFREIVNDSVQEYVRDTVTLALSSISINGMDATSTQSAFLRNVAEVDAMAVESDSSVYEAYDPRLASQLRDLYATLEVETTKVAELRRDAPSRAAQIYVQKLEKEINGHEEEFLELQRSNALKNQPRQQPFEVPRIERQERVQETWKDATENLGRLRGVTEAVALLERAQLASKELGTL